MLTSLITMVLVHSALAFTVKTADDGTPVAWEKGSTVHYYINAENTVGLDEASIVEAVTEAAAEWESTGADIALEYAGLTDRGTDPSDNVSVISFTSDWDSDESQAALTATTYTTSGQIVDSDITVNTESVPFSIDGQVGTWDLQNMMTHEFGHVLGLSHSETDELATMWATATPGETSKRDLRPDDEEGLLSIYGLPLAGTACGLATRTHSSLTLGLLVSLATLAGALRRRG